MYLLIMCKQAIRKRNYKFAVIQRYGGCGLQKFKQLQAILKQCPSILYCATITDITVDYLSFMRRMAVSCDDVSGQLDSGLRKRRKTLPYLRRIGIDNREGTLQSLLASKSLL
ncbi:hypothetical protein TPS_05936 [Trichinella pseudospiralis]